MEIVALVKVVADRETVEPDADRTTARPAASAFVNPYDQRAIRVALELRRPGERVTVVSMGPTEAIPLLAPYRDAGVDRIVLLADERLRGSDLLGTARALAAALRPLGRAIVLTGERATDSETGALAPTLSPLLWLPTLTRARSIVRDADGFDLDVTVDAEGGSGRYRIRAPCLISVSEKIAKPLKVAPGAAVHPEAVEVIDIDQLALSPSEVGRAGSQVRIISDQRIVGERTPRLFTAAELPGGVAAVAARWTRPAVAVATAPLLLPPPGLPVDRELLVLVTDDSGGLDPKSLSVLSGVRRMLPGFWPSAVWVGPHPSTEEVARLAAAGAVRGYGLHGSADGTLPVTASMGLERVLDHRGAAQGVLVVDHGFGLEVAGRFAGRRRLGLVTGVETVSTGPDAHLAWSKPSWGARRLVTIRTESSPSVVTVRPRFPPVAPGPGAAHGLDWIDLPFEVPGVGIHRLGRTRDRPAEYGDLDRADWVVAVGSGIGGPEAIQALARQIHPYGGAIAGTRRVVDAGWLPVDLQVGLTGRTPTPHLAILVGVSGAPNLMIGWRRAGTLVAINPEPNAPVFRGVDIGVVTRHEEALPALLRAIGVPVGSA